MDRPEWTTKDALLIYKTGAVWPTRQRYERRFVETAEFYKMELGSVNDFLQEELVVKQRRRQFEYVGLAGPYAVYREV